MKKQKFDVQAHLALWEKAVDVQQHFNNIGWQIRGLGLTVLTFTFGASGVTFENATPIDLWGWHVSPAFVVPIVGMVIWGSFWGTDAGWYHKLLVGAVRDATRLEKLLSAHGVAAELGQYIGAESPIWFYRYQSRADRLAKKPKVPRRFLGAEAKLHSKHKLHLFYAINMALLVGATIAFLLTPPPAQTPQKNVINVTNIIPTQSPVPALPPGPTSSSRP